MEYFISTLLVAGLLLGGYAFFKYVTQPVNCENCKKDCPCKRF